MKKFFASVLCLGMIVSSALLFTGCGSDIYVDGDFSREATEEEVSAVLREVEAGDVFGDMAAEGWSYGMNILGDMNMKMNISVGGKLMTAADADVDMDMKAVFDGGGLAASGSISAVMTTETPKLGAEEEDATQKSTMRVSGEAYIDGEAFYLDGTLSSSSGDEKTDIEGHLVVVDGAHTVNSVSSVRDAFLSVTDDPESSVLIFGAIEGKDIEHMLSVLLPPFSEVIITKPGSYRKSDTGKIFEMARSLFPEKSVRLVENPDEALGIALDSGHDILITGSFYLPSEMKMLRRMHES